MRIELTKGLFAEVDPEDFEWLNQWSWHTLKCGKHFYAAMREKNKGKIILMHRLILKAKKKEIVDHKDGNGLNNNKTNIRICNLMQNRANQKAIGKTLKFKGIKKHRKKFQAHIGYKNKLIYIGTFISDIEAARAYDKKALEIFGEFANINFPLETSRMNSANDPNP